MISTKTLEQNFLWIISAIRDHTLYFQVFSRSQCLLLCKILCSWLWVHVSNSVKEENEPQHNARSARENTAAAAAAVTTSTSTEKKEYNAVSALARRCWKFLFCRMSNAFMFGFVWFDFCFQITLYYFSLIASTQQFHYNEHLCTYFFPSYFESMGYLKSCIYPKCLLY